MVMINIYMRKLLLSEIKNANTLKEIVAVALKIINEIKKTNPTVRIGYVSGTVSSQGPDKIKDNLEKLHRHADWVESEEGINVFSAADIFNDETYWRLNAPRPVHEEEFYVFWKEILHGGITDIYMVAGWEQSLGATDEHETAKQLGLRIHYLK
jgi:uncharacterized protein DUF4406